MTADFYIVQVKPVKVKVVGGILHVVWLAAGCFCGFVMKY